MRTIYDYKIEDYKPAMGKRLRTYREKSNLTQENMAEILDISIKHYSEAERGLAGLSIEKLLFLSRFFHVSLDQLLKGGGNEDFLPSAIIEVYETCPDEKKKHLVEMIKQLNILIQTETESQK